MRRVNLEEAREHLDELFDRAVHGEDVLITADEGPAVRLTPIAVRKGLSPEEKMARREAILELVQKVRALPDLDTRSPDEILGYDEDGLFESADRR